MSAMIVNIEIFTPLRVWKIPHSLIWESYDGQTKEELKETVKKWYVENEFKDVDLEKYPNAYVEDVCFYSRHAGYNQFS